VFIWTRGLRASLRTEASNVNQAYPPDQGLLLFLGDFSL
jgi:hypothetical protein